MNNTIPEGATINRFPVCHLLIQDIPEDVFRVVFILYLLILMLCMYLNILFIKRIYGNQCLINKNYSFFRIMQKKEYPALLLFFLKPINIFNLFFCPFF